MEEPKSLIPYSGNYVLIHKRALFVNNFAASLIVQYLVQEVPKFKGADTKAVMDQFSLIAVGESNKIPDEKINEIILESVAKCHGTQDKVIQVNF